jgi:hypothetical protein
MVKVSAFSGDIAMQIAKRSAYMLLIETDEDRFGPGRYSAFKALKDQPEHKAQSAERSKIFAEINEPTTQRALLLVIKEWFPELV